ncbi:hypothetical protein [Rhodophyticola sp. CCM32]|uniref:hypothetical protein n=1 Tax=Rhodophyticola sp. CCM32 TaxID=2916397 RepID=UPI003FD1A63D
MQAALTDVPLILALNLPQGHPAGTDTGDTAVTPCAKDNIKTAQTDVFGAQIRALITVAFHIPHGQGDMDHRQGLEGLRKICPETRLSRTFTGPHLPPILKIREQYAGALINPDQMISEPFHYLSFLLVTHTYTLCVFKLPHLDETHPLPVTVDPPESALRYEPNIHRPSLGKYPSGKMIKKRENVAINVKNPAQVSRTGQNP